MVKVRDDKKLRKQLKDLICMVSLPKASKREVEEIEKHLRHAMNK